MDSRIPPASGVYNRQPTWHRRIFVACLSSALREIHLQQPLVEKKMKSAVYFRVFSSPNMRILALGNLNVNPWHYRISLTRYFETQRCDCAQVRIKKILIKSNYPASSLRNWMLCPSPNVSKTKHIPNDACKRSCFQNSSTKKEKKVVSLKTLLSVCNKNAKSSEKKQKMKDYDSSRSLHDCLK